MKNLYYNWYQREVAKIEKKETDSKKIISSLKNLLDEWDSLFFGSHDAEVIHRAIKRRIREEKEKLKVDNSLPTGFKCQLDPETVKEIYNLMKSDKQIKGELNDFLAIFNKTSIPFNKPVQWLVKRGNKPNKKALWTFLNLMTSIKTFSSNGNKEK